MRCGLKGERRSHNPVLPPGLGHSLGRSVRYRAYTCLIVVAVRPQREMALKNPLLETKLYAPRWRHGLVPRPRLSERLNAGAQSKLTLVSAPAGFGKTT